MFKEGNKLSKGRPFGSENRLTRKAKYYAEKFLDEIKRQGISEIATTGKMSDYINVIKAILPKDMNINHSGQIKSDIDLSKLTKQQLEQLRDIQKSLN